MHESPKRFKKPFLHLQIGKMVSYLSKLTGLGLLTRRLCSYLIGSHTSNITTIIFEQIIKRFLIPGLKPHYPVCARHTTNRTYSINNKKQQPFTAYRAADVPVILVAVISPYKTTLIALLPFRYNPIIILPGTFQNYRLLLLTDNGFISLEKFFTGLSSRLIHPVWWKTGVM